MTEEQPTTAIGKDELTARVRELCDQGYRLVQIGATPAAGQVELNYSFDRGGRFLNLRVTVPADDAEVPSITGIYWGAFLYENEIHDLFGVRVTGMAVDFKGTLYKTTVPFPFRETPAAATEKV